MNVPLRFPPAHDLPREVQHIIRFIVQRERLNFSPLHLPSVKMVEIKARAWSQTVFNFRTFLKSWVPGKPQECARRTWCSSETEHLFARVRQILPTSSLADLKLNDTTFLSDKQWTRIAGKELRMWCNRWRRWRLPDRVRSGLLRWMQQQLILHHRALQSDRHELYREVKHDLQVMQALVFTPVDHFPHSLHVACPSAFHELLTEPFWMPRSFGNALWARRLFLRILNPVFSPSLNGLGDTPGVASGPLLCLWLVFYPSPAKDLRRSDLLLLLINAGIHG